ncbi:hypothetical protein SAMN05660420_00230 [Desulfuromusa kysingii]|uniref:Uncharacterized protein n=1 Tax=Desulfuromusa kysingii TaxID=37625 RepID=A0A1H3VQU9_9BACT|nr:hypothetical protein [Desulfuromusa kysingii]SDZ77193.1 hypothetical protein SAMN05660420_00230 [Desulfuromusa kysingii]
MPNKKYSAGDHITSKCTKCKDITNHTIVAMVGDTVARVVCNTCNGTHNYRNASPKKTAVRNKTAASKSVKVNKIEAAWEDQISSADAANATPYNIKMVANCGDVIQHPTFGLGCVVNTIKPNKMEVSFRSGIKLLRCSVA